MRQCITSIKNHILAFCGRHIAVGEALRAVKNALLGLRFRLETAGIRTDEKTVLFCSFEGRSYADSPRAIFEYMVSCGKFRDYTLIWAFCGDPADHAGTLRCALSEGPAEKTGETSADAVLKGQSASKRARRGPHRPKICIVSYDTPSYRRALTRSGYWILNYKVKDYIRPRKDQTFVQCWHGTPLKKLGYDITHFDHALNTAAGNARHYGIEAGKFTYFISPSPYATEKFRSAWRLDEFAEKDVILETGYPRCDVLARAQENPAGAEKPQAVRQAAEESKSAQQETASTQPAQYADGKSVSGRLTADSLPALRRSGKTIILYAPTYRQNERTGTDYTCRLPLDPDHLREAIGDRAVVLFRAHYFITNRIDFSKYEGFLYDASDVEDINDLYLISDILVTDYSSTMFDFAVLRRPMIFYMYDLEYYRDRSNGFYFDPEGVLPGPIVRTQEALEEVLLRMTEEGAGRVPVPQEYAASYEAFLARFCPYEDGHSSERAVKRIFRCDA